MRMLIEPNILDPLIEGLSRGYPKRALDLRLLSMQQACGDVD